MFKYNEYLEFAQDIANHAGKIMLKYFNAKGISKYKGDRTIVTLADTEINSYLIKKIKEKYPTHSVWGEEEKLNNNSNHVWVCDPVDGTAQFARGVPVATFSLALVIDGISVVGVVLDPFTNSIYHAIKGQGAFKNNEKIQVNNIPFGDKKSISNLDVFSSLYSPNLYLDISPLMAKLCEKSYFVSVGSCVRASMLVAEGHYNLQLFPCKTNHDIAAVKIIVEEAGGIVRNFHGEEDKTNNEIKGAIVSNLIVFDETLAVIKSLLK